MSDDDDDDDDENVDSETELLESLLNRYNKYEPPRRGMLFAASIGVAIYDGAENMAIYYYYVVWLGDMRYVVWAQDSRIVS